MIVRNLRDPNRTPYKHHCSECESAPSQKCLDRYHLAYCDFCACIFTVQSGKKGGGCIAHPYSAGYNIRYKKIHKGMAPTHRTATETMMESEANVKIAAELERLRVAAAKQQVAKEKPELSKKEKKARNRQKQARRR